MQMPDRYRTSISLRPRLRLNLFKQTPREGVGKSLQQDICTLPFSFGRDALWYIAKAHMTDTALWLPAYICEQVVDVFERARVPYCFYSVGSTLSVDWNDLLSKPRMNSNSEVLLLIDYFGFPQHVPPEVADALRERFRFIIYDRAQSLPASGLHMPQAKHNAFTLYSLRKALPLPDLAFLYRQGISQGGVVGNQRRRLTARRKAYVTLETIGLVSELSAFRVWRNRLKAHDSYGLKPSWLSLYLFRRMDLSSVLAQRRQNAEKLLEQLYPYALFKDVPAEACPYYFPLQMPHRDAQRRAFWRAGVETTPFWNIPALVPPSFTRERRLSESLLGLPVHQDLTTVELAHIADTACEILGTIQSDSSFQLKLREDA